MKMLVEYFSSQFSVMQCLDFFIRVIVACLCGACIGLERSRRFKEAGIRTHIIVCCAAAVMMIVSKYAFVDLTDAAGVTFNGTRGADPARIAAQVVSGISFLGAGVIFKNGSTIKGLTTAAGIWATAGIGLAIGAGMYPLGLFVTAVIALLQFVMHKFKIGTDALTTFKLQFVTSDDEKLSADFFLKTEEWRAQIDEIKINMLDSGAASYNVIVRVPYNIKTEKIIDFFKSNKSVNSFSVIPIA